MKQRRIGCTCQDPAGNWTTRRPSDGRKETRTAVVWSCFPFIRSGQNHLARHSERGKKTRQTEEEVGRQHQGMDRPGVRQVQERSGEQGIIEKTGCKIICGAPTTLAVQALMLMMMPLPSLLPSSFLASAFSFELCVCVEGGRGVLFVSQELLLATFKRRKLAWFGHVTRDDQNHSSGRLGEWAPLGPHRKMMEGQREDVPGHARTARDGFLQKRLEKDLFGIVLHATSPPPPHDRIGKGTELN